MNSSAVFIFSCLSGLLFNSLLIFQIYYKIEYCSECKYVSEEEEHHGGRVDNLVSVYYIVYYVVRSTVSAHKEHVVIREQNVCDIRTYAERAENCKGDLYILSLHA